VCSPVLTKQLHVNIDPRNESISLTWGEGPEVTEFDVSITEALSYPSLMGEMLKWTKYHDRLRLEISMLSKRVKRTYFPEGKMKAKIIVESEEGKNVNIDLSQKIHVRRWKCK
jgi:hypothetical protein